MAGVRPQKQYCVLFRHEFLVLLETVATLDEAWAHVYEEIRKTHNSIPKLEPHPEAYARLPGPEAMEAVGVNHAFFDQPFEVSDGSFAWIAISEDCAFLVFGGDRSAWSAERTLGLVPGDTDVRRG